MCDRQGCSAKPEFRPVLVLRSPHWRNSARAVLGVRVCGICRYLMKLSDVLVDAGWEQLVEEIARTGIPLPHRDLTRLDFCRLRSAEGRRFERAQADAQSS